MKISDIGEFGWIKRVRARTHASGRGVLLGIGDDCAWLKTSDSTLITCDLLVEKVHFIRDMIPPRLLGRKSLSVNLSDIAAMGGMPDYAVVGVGLPQDIEVEYLDELLEGMLEVGSEHKVEIIGGDTTASPVLTISVTVLGRPSVQGPVLRSGAEPGDVIWVTGYVGDASLGFEILRQGRAQESEISDLHYSSMVVNHFDPEPRLAAGLKLAGFAKAMIDVSDGIWSDLTRILEESGKQQTLAAKIFVNQLPLSKDFVKYFGGKPLKSKEALSLALTGGEDYELLFTAPVKAEKAIQKAARELELNMTRIGKIERADKSGIILLGAHDKILPPPRMWFEHFPSSEIERSG